MPQDAEKTRNKEQQKAEKVAAKVQDKLEKAARKDAEKALKPSDVSEAGSGTPVPVPVDTAVNTSPNQTLHTPPPA